MSSALAGILNSLTPIATLLVSTSVFRAERPPKRAQGGILLGVVGVVIVAGIWNGIGHNQQLGVGACLLAVASFAVAFSYSPRFVTGRGEPIGLAAGQLLCGTVMLLPFAAAFGPTHNSISVTPLLGLVALGVLGTGIAYVLNFDIAHSASPTVTSSVTYLMPVVAVVAGEVFLHETINWYQPLGGAVILVGAALSQRARRAGGTASGQVSCLPVQCVE